MINEQSGVHLEGHIKIHNPESGHVFVNKRNAMPDQVIYIKWDLETAAPVLIRQVLLHT